MVNMYEIIVVIAKKATRATAPLSLFLAKAKIDFLLPPGSNPTSGVISKQTPV